MTLTLNRLIPEPLTIDSFSTGGKWTPCNAKGTFINSTNAMWVQDSLSGKTYLNQPTDCLRIKLAFLTGILAPAGNAVSLSVNAGYRALKIVSLSHFWLPLSKVNSDQAPDKGSYNFDMRCIELARDIIRIVAAPLALVALFFVSWGGALSFSKEGPRDATKLYSSIEIAMYGGRMDDGHFGWAPCYQPEATSHALGGDINKERAH
jgi:hypothetical protein